MSFLQSKFWMGVLLSGVVVFSFLLYFLFTASDGLVSADVVPIVNRDGEVVVYISNEGFNPEKITVRGGTQVKWINRDTAKHRVAFTLGTSLDNLATVNQELASGESLSFKFEKIGEYSYFDKNSNFSGKVTVK